MLGSETVGIYYKFATKQSKELLYPFTSNGATFGGYDHLKGLQVSKHLNIVSFFLSKKMEFVVQFSNKMTKSP